MGSSSYYHILVLSNVLLVFFNNFDRTMCLPRVNAENLGIKESLGLKKTPNVNKMNVSQENYRKMVNQYLKRRAKAEADSDPQIIRRFYWMEPFVTEHLINKQVRYQFIDHRFREHKLEGTTFRVQIFGKNLREGEKIKIKVFNVLGDKNTTLPIYEREAEERFLPKWIDVNIMEEKMNEVMLQVDCGGRCTMKDPTLNIFKYKLKSKRRKRSVHMERGLFGSEREKYINFTEGPLPKTDCRRLAHGKNLCCREKYELVFHDIPEFEWILQPFSYDIGRCAGECVERYNPTGYHATVHAILNRMGLVEHKSCCVPAKLQDIEILYLDDEDETQLKITNWHSLKALECSCS